MMEFGKSLRTAREAKGYTVQQLAEATRMAPILIDDLEREDFRRIAAPIYGRGFVKLYCEAVGLEAKPMIDEYMEIVNGNREPHIKERPLPPVDAPAETPQPQDPVDVPPPQPAPEPDLFATPEPTEAPRPLTSRYATPFRTVRTVPPAFWRIGALSLGGLVVLVLLLLGLRALHHATTTPASADEQAPSAAASTTAKPAAARTPQKIPAFYID